MLCYCVIPYRLGQLITLAGIDQSEMAIPLSSPQRQSLGGRLSSSFIKPRKLDLTYNDPAASPETSFRPIPNGMSGVHQLSAINLHQPSFPEPSFPEPSFPEPSYLAGHDISLNDRHKNVTMNTTGASSDGDISLPVPGSGFVFPRITPDNFRGNSDPTLPTAGVISIASMKPKSRFDELYQKVLRETEGVLVKNTEDESLDSTALGQSGLDYSSLNGSGDLGMRYDRDQKTTQNQSARYDRDHLKHSDVAVLSDGSQHSHDSRASRTSQKSTSKEASRETVIHQLGDQDNTLETLGLNPNDMIVEHHSRSDQSKSDKSDISDIEEIQEDLDIPRRKAHKMLNSDEEDF